MQAGCQFCDSAFQAEVASGRLTSGSLDTYSCVALAGVATEWLRFGHAEGGMADVQQLDRLLQALRFTQVGASGVETGQPACTAGLWLLLLEPSISLPAAARLTLYMTTAGQGGRASALGRPEHCLAAAPARSGA